MHRFLSTLSLAGLATGIILGMAAIAPSGLAATTCDNYLLASASPSTSVAAGSTVTLSVTCYNGSNAIDTTFTGNITATASAMGGSVTVTAPTTVTAVAGVATFTVRGDTAGFATVAFSASKTGGGSVSVTSILTVTGGGSNDARTSSDNAPSTPVEVSLSLDLAASGATCKAGAAARGVMGSWLYLPAADDCSSTTDPNAKLLGWSTSANFPVQRAQSQVDNRWGAIDEVFDGVRMIFIPAGQATFVSGPNSLYPIWAS